MILDTAGRLHVDETLMQELDDDQGGRPADRDAAGRRRDDRPGGGPGRRGVQPQRLAVTGLVLTKVDGDARGGAALSIREVTGVPIKFLGTGEKLDALEPFHPDRLASRILGMGDVLTPDRARPGDLRPGASRRSSRRSSPEGDLRPRGLPEPDAAAQADGPARAAPRR